MPFEQQLVRIQGWRFKRRGLYACKLSFRAAFSAPADRRSAWEAYPARPMSIESIYEYGSRSGAWRILREFDRRKLPLTIFGVAMALEQHAEITAAFAERNDEVACHGFRWIDYQRVDEAIEREHMRVGVDIIKRMTGTAPLGWYTVRESADARRLQHGRTIPELLAGRAQRPCSGVPARRYRAALDGGASATRVAIACDYRYCTDRWVDTPARMPR